MHIRAMEHGDIPALLDLWIEFMDDHTRFDPDFVRSEDATANFADYLAARIDDDRYRVWVAAEDKALTGFVIAAIRDYPPGFTVRQYGFIEAIAVTRRHRRRGVASGLLAVAQAWLRDAGMTQLRVTIDVANRASQSLFRGRGFEACTESLIKKLPSESDRS